MQFSSFVLHCVLLAMQSNIKNGWRGEVDRHPHGPQGTIYAISVSLVSGTQHRFQSNHAGLSQQQGSRTPAWPGAQVPSGRCQPQVPLGISHQTPPQSPRGLSTWSLDHWSDISTVLRGDTTSRHCSMPRVLG